jgi:CDP-glucose 4,6-dehydratase
VHYLVTGHTGFKGAWLTMMLRDQGHTVSGQSLDPLPGALFETAGLDQVLAHDFRIDIRDASATRAAFAAAQPDVVIHLAAQPLVRASYAQPRETYETNVMGTMNVLDAVQQCSSVRAHVVITTDKVYRNIGQTAGYVEADALGGDDPYSASKAMADLLAQSWMKSFPGCPTAIARAGNVIGGGDVSPDRLLPDLMDAFREQRPAILRYPDAVRPWQHVIDCLSGYLLLAGALLKPALHKDSRDSVPAWNFGPPESDSVPVGRVADRVAERWGVGAAWVSDTTTAHAHEAALLSLNSHKARSELNWHDHLNWQTAVDWTVDWHRGVDAGAQPADLCLEQLRAHAELPAGHRAS